MIGERLSILNLMVDTTRRDFAAIRDDIRDVWAGRCGATNYAYKDEPTWQTTRKLVRCQLTDGHDGKHDDCNGNTWED